MKKHVAVWAAACLGLVCSTSASALVTNGDASAYGVGVGVNAFNGALALGATVPNASVVSPPPGSDPQSLANVGLSDSRNVLLVGTYDLGLSTGLLSLTADSDVDGAPGSRMADATAAVENLDFGLSLTALVLTTDFITLTANNISSNAHVEGDAGSLASTGSSVLLNNAVLTLAGVNLGGIGVGVGLTLDANPAPNTQVLPGVLGPLGVALTLNKQVESCLAGDCSIAVDAIALEFTDFAFNGNLLNGSLTVAHSQAHLAAVVPEPASMALVGTSLLGLVGLARRRSA